MDCCICGPMASVFRSPRNTICTSCYEGGRSMIAFLNMHEVDGAVDRSRDSVQLQSNSTKGILQAWNYMNEMKNHQEEMKERMDFLEGFSVAFREKMHADIELKAGNGVPIPAHRALLATRSEIFQTMLDWDEFKAPSSDTISLPELSHEELQCLLQFLYSGSLSSENTEQHVYSMLVAADKYDIPFLKKLCEKRILGSLDASNALEVLEISEICSNKILKESAMSSIVKHMEEIVFSPGFERFALKNAHLCVEITRALFRENKDKKLGGTSQHASFT
ncbi:BTB/POZ domain-containing protein At3g56230-like [Aristolochia californica]|uniref:BTB/POZ domain-containing protein At3g56230-like n=1 Tax=Aristolochia californica TaxID=171875 RepID=UPI0035DD7F4D